MGKQYYNLACQTYIQLFLMTLRGFSVACVYVLIYNFISMLLARRANEQKHIFSNIPSYIGPKFKANLKSENRTNYLVILLSDTYHTVFQLILLRLVCSG